VRHVRQVGQHDVHPSQQSSRERIEERALVEANVVRPQPPPTNTGAPSLAAPLDPAIEAFEILARTKVALGPRAVAAYADVTCSMAAPILQYY
jgi:hypothetical protein